MSLPRNLPYGDVMMPYCNMHLLYGQKVFAEYYGNTTEGITAYMCANCFQDYGIGLGHDMGYKLDEEINDEY